MELQDQAQMWLDRRARLLACAPAESFPEELVRSASLDEPLRLAVKDQFNSRAKEEASGPTEAELRKAGSLPMDKAQPAQLVTLEPDVALVESEPAVLPAQKE